MSTSLTVALRVALGAALGMPGFVRAGVFPGHATLPALTDRPSRTSSRDVKIPLALVQKIETEYRQYLTKNAVSTNSPFVRKMLNMSAELREKQHVLVIDNVRVVTPLGGGVVDLSEFVTPLRGAFWMKIVVATESGPEPEGGLRMFFVSRAKARALDGETYGSGCDKFMEVTSLWRQKQTGKGFELFTADRRYLSVIGGTFVAVAFAKEALYVGSLTFKDSRYPELFCD